MLYKEAITLFKRRLKEVYGDNLVDVILYGSYARGEQEEGSDIDLFILLREINDFWKEVHKIADIAFEISKNFDYKVFISAIPETIDEFQNKVTPLFLNIKREGIRV